MVIKLKAKKSINKRIMASFMTVLIVTLLITIVMYSVLSRQFIISQTRQDLKQAASVIEENMLLVIKRTENTENSHRTRKITMLSDIESFNSFMKMITVIEDEEGKVIILNEGLTKERLASVLKQTRVQETGYIYYVHDLKDSQLPFNRWILLKRYEDVASLRNIGLRAFIISFSLGIIIALIISSIVSQRLTKPIFFLKKGIDDYMIDKKTFKVYPSNDEIESVATSFKKLADKVTKLDERQKQFFQNSSHELKTPLMSIQGYVEAIKDGIVTEEDMDNSLDIIISETQRLKNIVDDVIYLSKIDSLEDEFKLEDNHIKGIIEDAIEVVMPLLTANHLEIEVTCDKSVSLICDYDKFKRVFINLIGNASRYAKSKIIVNANQHEDHLTIDVIDDGNGFEYGQEENVFDRFFNGKNGGSGIGLSLTKEIVEKHGGQIKAINNMNYGAIIKMAFKSKS